MNPEFTGDNPKAPTGFVIAALVGALAAYILAPSDLLFVDSGFQSSRVTHLAAASVPFILAGAPLLTLVRPALGVGVGLVPVISLIVPDASVTVAQVVALAAVAAVASWSSRRWALGATVLAWLLVLVPVTRWRGLWVDDVYQINFYPGDGVADVLTYAGAWAVALFSVLGIALFLANQAHKARRLAQREDELAGQVETVDEQATVLGERARLARDLHDVVAHHVSLIAVRAETAPYADPAMPAKSRQVLAEIATDARSALDELRGVLGILQRAGGDADRSPLPGLDDVTALVERARGAGDDVRLERVGDAGTSNATTGYVAYRVVQEALTNARKHAAGRPVTISLEVSDDAVQVRVGNPTGGSSGEGARRGLAGMRERVEGIGGTFSAGFHDDEFIVDARIPARVSA